MTTLKGVIKREFRPEVSVRVGTLNGGKAVLVGETWAYLVDGHVVCAANGSGHSFMRHAAYCDVGVNLDDIEAAATRTYRWSDF